MIPNPFVCCFYLCHLRILQPVARLPDAYDHTGALDWFVHQEPNPTTVIVRRGRDPFYRLGILEMITIITTTKRIVVTNISTVLTHVDPTLLSYDFLNCFFFISKQHRVNGNNFVDYHDFMSVEYALVAVEHVQCRFKPKRAHALVYDRVAPLHDVVDGLEVIIGRRIAMPQPKCKRSAFCHEFWVLNQPFESFTESILIWW